MIRSNHEAADKNGNPEILAVRISPIAELGTMNDRWQRPASFASIPTGRRIRPTLRSEPLEQRMLLASDLAFFAPEPLATISPGSYPNWQVLADFNGDGRTDVAAGGDSISVGLQQDDHTFSHTAIRHDADRAGEAGDVDGDGDIDLVVANDRRIRVLMNSGRDATEWLGFETAADLLASDTSSLLLADLDANHKLDILAATPDGLLAWLQNENGEYGEPVHYLMDRPLEGATSGDFDQDGDIDIAVTDSEGKEVVFLTGNGDGTFEESPFSHPLASETFAGGGHLATGDFDEDGDLDLAIAQNYSLDDNVEVLLGHGDGTFEPSGEKHEIIGGPRSIFVDDLNHDGHLDLAIGHGGVLHHPRYDNAPGGISVLLGIGDGSFEDPIRMTRSEGTLATGDVDGDGWTDLVIHDYLDNDPLLFVLRNATEVNSPFQHQFAHATGQGPVALTAEDLNQDSLLDVVVTNQASADVSMLLGTANGSFAPEIRYNAGSRPIQSLLGDFNQDQRPDLAVVNDADITMLLANDDGTFQQEQRYGVGDRPADHVLLDWDGDDHLDVLVANSESNDISLVRGLGDGKFTEVERFAVGEQPVALAIGDLNQDGKLDLAVANSASSDVSILLADQEGGFQNQMRVEVGDFYRLTTIAVSDLNADGLTDIAVGGDSRDAGSQLVFVLNDGQGSFAGTTDRHALMNTPATIQVIDVNADDRADLLVSTRDRLYIWLATTEGLADPRTTSGGPEVVTGDVNHDGNLDLVSLYALGSNQYVRTHLGDGTGSFTVSSTTSFTYWGITAMSAQDVNGDGNLDLVAAVESNLLVMLGDAMGKFSSPLTYVVGVSISSISPADFDLDGDIDILVTNRMSNDLSVAYNQGNGSFTQETRFPVDLNDIQTAVSTDFDRDGVPDILAAGWQGLRLLLGQGDGTLAASESLISTSLHAVAMADVNGDGREDILGVAENALFTFLVDKDGHLSSTTTSRPNRYGIADITTADLNADGATDVLITQFDSYSGGGRVEIYLGNGDGTFSGAAEQQAISVGENPVASTVSDVNGDGRLDIVVASQGLMSYNESADISPGGSYSVILGRGEGRFEPAIVYYLGDGNDFRDLTVRDLNDDGYQDLLLVNAHGLQVLTNTLPLPGDVDQNGTVEFADFLALSAHFGATDVSWQQGDFNADHSVDFADFLLLSANFGRSRTVT